MKHLLRRAVLLCGSGVVCCMLTAGSSLAQTARTDSVGPARVLDQFDGITGWGTFPSDGVRLELQSTHGVTGRAMTMAYDFQGRAGYAIARKALAIGTPAGNWAISFRARGAMRPNTLEFKLVDRSGDNVWWYTIPEYRASSDWSTVVIRQRQVSFAWGPIGGGPPRDIANVEIVVTAGQGGRGSLSIDDLVFTPLPADVPASNALTVIASSNSAMAQDAGAITDADSSTVWQTVRSGEITIDFGGVRVYGGLVIDWAPGQHASRVIVDTSNAGATNTGARPREAGRLVGIRGGRSYLPIPDGSSRYLHLRIIDDANPRTGNPRIMAIRGISVRPLTFAATPTALMQSIGREAPRGHYPRSFRDEQTYWAVVGVSGGRSEALLSEDGQLEIAKRGPTLEPFLSIRGASGTSTLVDWSRATTVQSLHDGVRPIPSVEWRTGDITLRVTAFAAGTSAQSSSYARYRVINRGTARMAGTFWLALRPLQVNPPWQFLNTPGGAASVDSLSWNGSTLQVSGRFSARPVHVRPLTTGARVGVSTLDAGEAISWITRGEVPPINRVADPRSLASAVMAWSVNIAPGDSTDIVVTTPLDGSGDPARLAAGSARATRAAAARRLAQVAATWARDQDAVTMHLPASAPALGQAIKANLAWILINRDGPGIQPGSRSYERSWIRDGSLTAEALLRLGRATEARQFADWYAPFQYPNGKVPCCVDSRGADPVDEHDSHGELVHLAHEVWRYTGDRAFADRMWPHVRLAAQHLDSLRRTHLTPQYNTPALLPYRGLLPPSISHEGYSAKPMHSFWDDGFALVGFREAAAMAAALGHSSDARRIAGWRDAFGADLHASLRNTMTLHKIGYLPGSVELGDFDATSTTTLLTPGGELSRLPRAAVDSTFSRYFRAARARASADTSWNDYTPYEWRTVGSLLRLGRKAEALELVTQFMGDRRPAAWQQWAEVVWRDPRAPKFLGDMPHTWVGSDFIRSALDLFAYEREADSALVVGAGVAAEWVVPGDSVMVRGLRTPWGPLGYTMSRMGNVVTLRLDAGLRMPPGGLVIHTPLSQRITRARADGADVAVQDDGTVRLRRPARVLVLTHQ
ncbi:MAG: coagulation factor 5/8 type domain-containing protein [Gemmatimonadota bacterium]